MKIEGREVKEFNTVLDEALKSGLVYIVVPALRDDAYLRPETVHFFQYKREAENFGYTKRSVEGEIVDAVPILPVKNIIDRNLELQSRENPTAVEIKDIKFDISLIRFQEQARSDIFTEDIMRQLKVHHIIADLKELKKNIQDDKLSFEVDGKGQRQDGGDRFVIKIEQNEHRAFTITSINAVKQLDTALYIKSDAMQADLLKSDIPEIKTIFSQERENGNRFVSYPANEVLGKDSFSFFKSSFGALQHAYENSTDRDIYIIRSVIAIEQVINQLMENKKEKQAENQYTRSGGQSLSL
ncbi:MAG: hypothetical protein QM763_09330 [Agriterribacter sp.]